MTPAQLEQAACKKMHPGVFFPETKEGVEIAKAVCRRCRVCAECLDYALRLNIDFGVFGAHSALDRRRLQSSAYASPIRPNTPTKVCSRCTVELPSDRFNRNRTRADGLHNECKQCRSSRDRASREKAS